MNQIPLIGITGLKGSGKDTAFELIKKHYPSVMRKAFADEVKNTMCSLFNVNPLIFNDQELKNVEFFFTVPKLNTLVKHNINKRYIKMFFDLIDEFYFNKNTIKITPRKLIQLIGYDLYKTIDNMMWINKIKFERNVIITDVRLPEEADEVYNNNGVILKINRSNDVVDNHITETSQTLITPNFEIENDGSIEELETKILQTIEIIKGKV